MRFFVINNGLKGLRGHYYETAVSIAEAARDRGFRVILGAHVDCPAGLVPAGLELHPVFRTDHWMPAPAPCEPPAPPAASGVARWVKSLAKRCVPRGLLPAARFLHRRAHWPWRVARAAVWYGAPPGAYGAVRRAARAGWGWLTRRTCPRPAPAVLDPLHEALVRCGSGHEFRYMNMFREDLERLLGRVGFDPGDHVFIPTAHGRELAAVCRVVDTVGPEWAPRFHLEFRHAMDFSGCFEPEFVPPYVFQHQVYFKDFEANGGGGRVGLYTDTPELASEYHSFCGLSFRVLPIPFRTRFIEEDVARPRTPLCLAYLGDVRDEKGFYRLEELAEAISEPLAAGAVRLLIQGSYAGAEGDRKSAGALERLKRYPRDQVELVGLDGPLSPDEYYRLVSSADVLLCPYQVAAYRSRSSGTFAEAVAAGIPTVVPAGTWLAARQPPGSGETYPDQSSFARAVRLVCQNYAEYRRNAGAARAAWLAGHSPARLVDAVIGGSGGEEFGSFRAA